MRKMRDEGKYSFSFDPDLSEPYYKPTLILTGRQDSMTGYQDVWKLLESFPHASFAVLDRAGHNLHLEQESILEVMVKEWLNRIKSGVHIQ
ncbi:alpha/beta hydrolase fold protein [compost metagenome]